MIGAFNSLSVGDTVMAFLLNLSSKMDVSPVGFLSILTFIHDSITVEYKAFAQKIFKSCIKLLCSLMRDNQLLSVQEWPDQCGGGFNSASAICNYILKSFHAPFNIHSFEKEAE
mmetsp:Transcript_3462/g.2458  ORF Transcript_3462/g.2458 Transcript_3462/m.2458 type:complete len:114 (-) Transcript_3462:957-1298(-)